MKQYRFPVIVEPGTTFIFRDHNVRQAEICLHLVGFGGKFVVPEDVKRAPDFWVRYSSFNGLDIEVLEGFYAVSVD